MSLRSQLALVLIFYSVVIDAQTATDNWYFGYSAGIKFQNDSVYADTHSNIIAPSGGVTWSTPSGELLFYAGQYLVNNRNHEMMPNGLFSISGTVTQTPVVCPNTADDAEYFLFALEGQSAFYTQLRYSVISMNLDSGLGDIDTNRKRIFLQDSLSGNMTSYPKCDGTGHWLIVRGAYNINFYVYSISNGELDTIPQIFPGHVVPNNYGPRLGEMNVSPDGTQLALIHFQEGEVEFLDFDAQTGQLSNPFSVNIGSYLTQMPYGLEFSPSGDQLYVSCNSAFVSIVEAMLIQLNLTQYDSVNIANSIDTILLDSFYAYSQQTGPDGRIYIAARDTFLHCILNPDEAGQSCEFTLNHVDLSGRFSHVGLPQFDQGSLINPINDRIYCLGDTAFFEYNDSCLVSLLWNFGDSNSGNNTSTSNSVFHVFSDTGVYNTTLEVNYSAATKSYANTITVLPNEIMDEFNDTIYLCDSTLCVNQSLVDYEWSTGETSRCISVSQEGLYAVTLSNACDTTTDTVFVRLLNSPDASLPPDTALCGNASLTLAAPSDSSFTYMWSTGASTSSITIDSSTTDETQLLISLSVTNDCGIDSDSMRISFLTYPRASLPNDSAHCSESPITLTRPNELETSYLWSDSTDERQLIVNASDTVWLQAKNKCGIKRDTIAITFYPEIKAELGEDTMVCSGNVVTLNANWPEASYLWNTGSEDSVIFVSEPGNYIVTISNPPCSKIVSRSIAIDEKCDSTRCRFSVPNVFTPNGDGINDILWVSNQCNNELFSVFIYNRWGQLILSQKSTPTGFRWDGTLNGEPATSGTYYIAIEKEGSVQHRQSVSLMR